MKKFLAPVVGFLLLSILLAYALIQIQSGEMSPRDIPSPLVGKPLPAFALKNLYKQDRQVTQRDFAGQVYLLNVWASWCAACREEHPLLMVLPKQEGVLLVGLDYKDKDPDAFAFLKQLGDPYDQILVDADGKYGIDLGVYGVPETFLVDHDGIIRFKHIGPINQQVWRDKIAPLVRELKLKASQAVKS